MTSGETATLQPLQIYLRNHVKRNSGKPSYTYSDMLIYNDLAREGETRQGLESLIAIYDKLYGFGLSLSGYQFIGLLFERAVSDQTDTRAYPLAYFLLAIGFVVSLFGSLLSFCMYEFLVLARSESNEYIARGIVKYRYWLKLPHDVLQLNTLFFALPINIIIHRNLSLEYGILFNLASAILLGIGFPIHYRMIMCQQTHAFTRIERDEIRFNMLDTV